MANDNIFCNEKLLTDKISTLGKKNNNAQKLLMALFSNPVIDVKTIDEELNITPRAANGIVKDFVRLNILREVTGQRRNRLFIFDEYLKILER